MQLHAPLFGQFFERAPVLVDAVGERANQRRVGGDFHRLLLALGQFVPHVFVDVHVGVHHHLVQTLQVVVLQHFLKAEHAVRFRAAPLGGVDHAFFQRRQNVAAAHRHRGDADVLVGLPRNSRRSAEAVFAEVVHALDRLFEPAKRLRSDRLQHQALDVHAHLVPQLVIQRATAAVHVPGEEGDVVNADAGAGDRRAEQHCGRMFARPVMRPGEAGLHQAFVHRVENVAPADNRAVGQDLDFHLAVGQRRDIRREVFDHDDFIRFGRQHRLHADGGLGEGVPRRECARKKQAREFAAF